MSTATTAPTGGFRLSQHELALIGITVLWGSTFLVIHTAMNFSGPMFFVGMRFLVAGLAAAAIFWRWLRGITLLELGAGVAIGAALALGYGLQTIGLQTISSSMSGFITAFYVPLVPLMQWAFLRKPPGKMSLIGAGLAFAGLIVLGGPGAAGFNFGFGEWATVAAAVACAVEVILISAFASKRVEFRRVTVVQLLATSGFAFLAMPLTGETAPEFDLRWLIPAVALGLASMLIQLTMNWAQRHVSATRATIIYSAEPVWAGVIGAIAGDQLPWFAFVGAALIITGVLVSEIKPNRKQLVQPDESAEYSPVSPPGDPTPTDS
ncbi:DMT family transporter [Leucobacter sp. UT-8R-CII-1-4]|uniref:DMT family transporter n=1 Tax=Leucobacter sp. UT-8R-CII-1-4 TaxID=3040075 RepID=UPI0024A94AA1|nr:DMT family transporter [Leucobacter sp. UT-8R-CII-1-4]MDI6024586.1 DMT family transporter [Leucobacter sp. UT-8R-CII-1-4]